MEGVCHPVDSFTGKARAYSAYFQKFPFARALISDPQGAAGSFATARAHLFRPSYLRFIDNSRGIGARWDIRLANGRPLGPPEQ